jgi:AraC family transcriptional regulator of arabinose operon
MEHNPLATVSGFKRFFSPPLVASPQLTIRGIGVRETMPPGLIERPDGRGDFLFMLFHEAAAAGCAPRPRVLDFPDIFMIWTPGKPQYYGHPTERFTHTWIHCDGARIRRILRHSGLPVLKPFAVSESSRFQQSLLDIHSELVSYLRPEPLIIGNLLENSLLHLARTQTGPVAATRVPENLLAVRRFIGGAPATPVTLPDLAAMAGMSVPHFSAVFRKTFGLPPMECLIQHRLHHAARLLDNPNLTISEIAAEVGYQDLFHFSKIFKKHFGVSPRDMRKRGLHGPSHGVPGKTSRRNTSSHSRREATNRSRVGSKDGSVRKFPL